MHMAMDGRTDEQLVADYLRGKDDAFDRLVERYLPVLYRFLARFTASRADAEDAAQDAVLKAWKAIRSYDPRRPFRTWLFTIAKNTALDMLRKKNPTTFSALSKEEEERIAEDVPDTQPLPDALLERAQAAHLLEETLAALPPKARMVVLMHDTEELTFQDISEVLREPMNTVKSRYHRAMKRLEELLRGRLG